MRFWQSRHGKRAAALGILLCFLLAAVLSEAFLLTHAHHRHDHLAPGGGCAVCAQMQSVAERRGQSGAAPARAAAWLGGLWIALALLCRAAGLPSQTPVALKMRLNN